MSADDKRWAKRQAKEIRKLLLVRYGNGWHYLSDEQQHTAILERVLYLILAQAAPEMKPAQELARSVLRELFPPEEPKS